MSQPLLRPCNTPGCPALVRGGPRCAKHARQTEQDRGTPEERGYDKHHRILRVACFERDNWQCADCGWQPDLVTLYARHNVGIPETSKILAELRIRHSAGDRHLHADHIQTIEDRPDLRLVLSNLATRCDRCHFARTMKQSSAKAEKAPAFAAARRACV